MVCSGGNDLVAERNEHEGIGKREDKTIPARSLGVRCTAPCSATTAPPCANSIDLQRAPPRPDEQAEQPRNTGPPAVADPARAISSRRIHATQAMMAGTSRM